MYSNNYLFAGVVVKICSIYPNIHQLCNDYQSTLPEKEDIVIHQQDIQEESKRLMGEAGYIETLVVLRKLTQVLMPYKVLLFHGSAIMVDHQVYLFTARSGVGKSTHARLWKELLENQAVIINDDKPFLKIQEHQIIVYGNPWDGKHHLSNNTCGVLKGICLLKRGKTNSIQRIPFHKAFPYLLQQCFQPDQLVDLLILLDQFENKVEFYELYCNQTIEAASIAYNTMKGN